MNPAVAEFFAQYGFDPAQPSALQPDRHFTPLMRAAWPGDWSSHFAGIAEISRSREDAGRGRVGAVVK